MTTKKSAALTLSDRLSRLSYNQACKLLGPEGKRLLQAGSRYEVDDLEEDVYLSGDLFRLNLRSEGVIVTITMLAESKDRLKLNCNRCETVCEHLGATLAFILEEKLALGLSELPPERIPIESLGEAELVQRALDERTERAKKEKFRLASSEPDRPWTDYQLLSASSGKTYRLALRGEAYGESYCSCPDFRTNTLGTCKHLIYALDRIRRKFSPAVRKKAYRNRELFVHLAYGEQVSLRMCLPDKASEEVQQLADKCVGGPIKDIPGLMRTIRKLEQGGHAVTIYPDAEEFIDRRLQQARLVDLTTQIRVNPANHPLRKKLLKEELLPYQLDGVAFVAGAGRAILADDMGLGKTIQGIGAAELLAQEANVRRVLVICPASVKSQWRNEIRRFSNRDVQIVVGPAAQRGTQYESECFFTICNYEQVLRDIQPIERAQWDLIILDEGQRIKNWESKTARVMKGLKSTFALVLSGTPLGNRLDDLYSVAQFVDDRRLGPAFRFQNRHRIVDERGKVLGYKNLAELRSQLRPILLRRTKDLVLKELPPRTTEIVRIPPTEEQKELHDSHMRIVSQIARKSFITEMDLLRLQKALLMCRMTADSTFLVEKKKPAFSSKLDRLAELLEEMFSEPDRKAVVFSEWTTMLDIIEPLLKKLKLEFVRLDGSVPQKQRQELVHRFQQHSECRLFLTTNAGSTGLNLQAANTVINVDLPWNPAVLEQRIARAHRMGQKQPVQVYILVTEETIEENLLATLSAKHELSLAVLDENSDASQVDMVSGIEELRRRLEVLLGAKSEAPVDQSMQTAGQALSAKLDSGTTMRRERLAEAGGELLGSAFRFLGELVSAGEATRPPEQLVSDLHRRLAESAEFDKEGRPRLTITLPDRSALKSLADTMARLLVMGNQDGI